MATIINQAQRHDDPDFTRSAVPADARMGRLGLSMAWWSVCSAMFWLVVSATLAMNFGTQNAIIGLLTDVARQIVPLEVVCPPVPADQLAALDPMVSALRAAGALGTSDSLIYAFGLHINTELPDFDSKTLVPYLKAYCVAQNWLVKAHRVDALRRLLDAGRHVLVQPYLRDVDSAGETALLFFDGEFSHAIRKAPLLRRGEEPTRALFKDEHIQPREPSAQEREVAAKVLAALPFGPLVYARVDLLPSPTGPQLLELELTASVVDVVSSVN